MKEEERNRREGREGEKKERRKRRKRRKRRGKERRKREEREKKEKRERDENGTEMGNIKGKGQTLGQIRTHKLKGRLDQKIRRSEDQRTRAHLINSTSSHESDAST